VTFRDGLTLRCAAGRVLLTDIVIPGMSGRELAEIIHRHHPATAILYASGYSPEQVAGDLAGPQASLLEKPYSQARLASKVREILDARAWRTDVAAAGAEPAEPRAPADSPRGDDEEPAIDQGA